MGQPQDRQVHHSVLLQVPQATMARLGAVQPLGAHISLQAMAVCKLFYGSLRSAGKLLVC